jgi:hypothetical protein
VNGALGMGLCDIDIYRQVRFAISRDERTLLLAGTNNIIFLFVYSVTVLTSCSCDYTIIDYSAYF